jgi:aspartate-semialdehyde dehydrogenase
MEAQSKKYKVGILGATGIVGQTFIKLLLNNPRFEIVELGASEKSVGKTYNNACKWKLSDNIFLPDYIQNKYIKQCSPENFKNCDLIFSALNGDDSGYIEKNFVLSDFPVISNSSFYRNSNDIPLIVPFINNDHLQMITKQRIDYNLNKGFLITNANCVVTPLMYVIYNLHKQFNLKQMNIVTMQAISGSGYNGLSGYDITNNIIPYIYNEEDKLKQEPLKILGELTDNIQIKFSDIQIDACCNRVNVTDGHTLCVSIKFEKHEDFHLLNLDEIKTIILQNNNCIRIFEDFYRPQPRIDINYMNGYGISVGRIRKGNYWDLEMTIVSNNIVLGAAGSAILNAESCIEYGLI